MSFCPSFQGWRASGDERSESGKVKIAVCWFAVIERVPVFNSAAVLNESPASIHIVSMLSGAWQLVESGDQRAEVWVWV